MNKLHFNTTIKRIKDLMLSPDFNEMTVKEFYPGIFSLAFPNDIMILVYLASDHLGYASPYEIFYYHDEEYGRTTKKMQITWKFVFAVWNKFSLNNPVLNDKEKMIRERLEGWARNINRGYAKCLWDNKTIINA